MLMLMMLMSSIPVDTPIPHLGHCLQASTLKLSGQFIIMMLIMNDSNIDGKFDRKDWGFEAPDNLSFNARFGNVSQLCVIGS